MSKEQPPKSYIEIILSDLAKKPTEELVRKLEAESKVTGIYATRWGQYYQMALRERIKGWPEDLVQATLFEEYSRNGETAWANLLDGELVKRWRHSGETEYTEEDSHAVPLLENETK